MDPSPGLAQWTRKRVLMFSTVGTEAVGAPLGAAVFRSAFSATGRTDLEFQLIFTTHFQVCLCQNALIEVISFFPFLKFIVMRMKQVLQKYSTPPS